MSRIIFIATREPQYSRVSLVRRSLAEQHDVYEIVSTHQRYSLRLVSVILQLLRAWIIGELRHADAVVVGFFAQPIFPLVRMLFRGPIVADAYFSIFDTVVHDKQTASAGSLKGRLCRWLDTHMLSKAELCLTDTLAHAAYFKSEFGVPTAKVERLWISAESKPLESLPLAPLRDEPLEVFFWGGFIPLQGVETIINAANLLKSQNVRFTIFGEGQTFAACKQLRESQNVHNVNFCGWKSPAEIQIQAGVSHLALGIFGATDKAGRVIPNKVFEAMALGLPLITRESSAINELLNDGYDVLTVPPADPRQLADKISWVQSNYGAARDIALRAQQTFETSASPQKIGRILQRQMESVLTQAAAVSEHAPLAAARQSEY